MKLSKIVREAIARARAANKARTVEGIDDDSPILTSSGDASALRLRTKEECRLREFLEAQPPPVVYMLTAIMYLGRGDFDAAHVLDQYTDLSETFGNAQWAVRLMLGKMLLPEHLQAGLKKLAQAGMDVDQLLTA